MAAKPKEPSFEEALKSLEGIVARLESGEANLDESIRLFEEGMRLSLELASAVRDQYAHQAHTIILGNATHLGFYAEAERRVAALTQEVKARPLDAEERAWLGEVERSTAELDRIFRQRIVPAVLRRDTREVQLAHAAARVDLLDRRPSGRVRPR